MFIHASKGGLWWAQRIYTVLLAEKHRDIRVLQSYEKISSKKQSKQLCCGRYEIRFEKILIVLWLYNSVLGVICIELYQTNKK